MPTQEESKNTIIELTPDEEKETVTISENIEITDAQKDIFLEKYSNWFYPRTTEGIGIEELSFEKKMLLLDTLEQQVLDKVKRSAKEAFEDELKKWKIESYLEKRQKRVQHRKERTRSTSKAQNGESLVSQETAKALAETVSSITAPITYKEGRIEISYMEEKRREWCRKFFCKRIQYCSKYFFKIPAEWQFSHNKKNKHNTHSQN